MIINHGFTLMTNLIIGISIYLDPNMVYFAFTLKYLQHYLKNPNSSSLLDTLKTLILWSVIYFGLAMASGDQMKDFRNHFNILTVSDHNENIGIFWYLFIEVKLSYYNLYVVIQIACTIFPIHFLSIYWNTCIS